MKKKKKATKWIIFARVLLVLQLIASAMIFAMAVKTKMLPAKYIMFAAGGLLIMEFLVFALVHLGQNIMMPRIIPLHILIHMDMKRQRKQ